MNHETQSINLSRNHWLRLSLPRINLSNRLIAVVLFFFVLLTQMQFPINQTLGDPVWALPTAFSLVYRGSTSLSEYQPLIAQQPGLAYTVQTVDNTPYNIYPIGTSLIAVPFVAVLGWITQHLLSIDLFALSQQTFLLSFDMFIACAIVAATAVLLYWIARFYLGNAASLLIALIFAFCTTALSVASRALWQHGPSILLVSITIYALLRAPRTLAFLTLAGFALAFSFITRPTNSLPVIIFTIYVLLRYRLHSFRFFVGALIVALPFFYFNLTLYHQLLPPYYISTFIPSPSVGALLEALAGNLISPNRGLLIFSPVLIFSLIGIGLKLRARSFSWFDGALVLIILSHWFLMSVYLNWWAGFTFGPRYMTDILPYLTFFLIPCFVSLPKFTRLLRWLTLTVLALTIAVSLAINFRGATEVATQQWNSIPASVDVHPERVWDWDDLQFLRGIGEPLGSTQRSATSAYRFEFDADSQRFETSGWGDAEHFADGTTFQWMTQKQASLSIWLVSTRDLQVKIGIMRAVVPDLLKTFTFSVNGHPIALTLDNGIYTGVIPAADLITNGTPSELQFSVDYLVSPKSLGENDDTRTLGLMVNYLDIYP